MRKLFRDKATRVCVCAKVVIFSWFVFELRFSWGVSNDHPVRANYHAAKQQNFHDMITEEMGSRVSRFRNTTFQNSSHFFVQLLKRGMGLLSLNVLSEGLT